VFSYGAHLTPRGMALSWLAWKGKSKDGGAANSRTVDVFIPLPALLRSARTFHLALSYEFKSRLIKLYRVTFFVRWHNCGDT
jgi:hypothetical protein